jgi:diamine N-acetyltransferase
VQKWEFWTVKLQIKAAETKDIPQITALATQIWNVHYPPIIGQEQVDYMLNKIYNKDSLLKQMEEGQQYFLLLHGGEIAGFMAVSTKGEDIGFIHKFYVQTTAHRKGLGSAAFKELMQAFPNTLGWRLQVNRQNISAINFYFKMGFTIEKAADFDIGDGYFMNDFVMLRHNHRNA